jgi:prophage antirepressor-like protein
MKNNIVAFKYNEQQVRTIEKNGEPWFVGKDVAEILGYSDTAQAVRKHIDNEDKGVVEMTTPGGKQPVTIINESGLYSLILSSKLPTAKEFKHWVTSEVLPSIRKTGEYKITPAQ